MPPAIFCRDIQLLASSPSARPYPFQDYTAIASSLSPRGTSQSCSNKLESGAWTFVVKGTCLRPIRHIRLDYVGTGLPAYVGLAFDNFWAYGCKIDARYADLCASG